jgi:hypothetical protein
MIKDIIIGYIIGTVALLVLIYLLSRIQMKGWLDEINKHFKNFNPNLYERKEK